MNPGPSQPIRRQRIDPDLSSSQQAIEQAARDEIQREEERRRQREAINCPISFLSQLQAAAAHSLGPLTHECIHCVAVHFIDEQVLLHREFPAYCSRGDS